jgi:hypothetical protein
MKTRFIPIIVAVFLSFFLFSAANAQDAQVPKLKASEIVTQRAVYFQIDLANGHPGDVARDINKYLVNHLEFEKVVSITGDGIPIDYNWGDRRRSDNSGYIVIFSKK